MSLGLAAAMRMGLNVDLEGKSWAEGRVVLSGASGATIDAALFLTALRLACEREEPYFSLERDSVE